MQRTKCPICRNITSKKVFQSHHRNVVICLNCQFMYANSFNEKMLNVYYKTNYYESEDDPRIEKWASKYKKTWMGVLCNLIQSQKIINNLLDVGAGTGGFLNVVHEILPAVELDAIETSTVAMEAIRKRMPFVSFITKSLEDIKDMKKYDAITMLQCLEHVYEPLDFLMQANALLCDSGILLITVPNRQTFRAFSRGYSEPYCFANPTHLQFFDYKTLKSMLIKAGFINIKRIVCYGGTEVSGIKASLQYVLRTLRISSELRVIAKKR